MTRYGFHASHEQVSPADLLRDVQHAEQAGFAMAMCSDHFAPWSARQGHSGYTWSWLGAALATTDLEMGCVSAPGQRYHPAVAAQKIATLSQMFEGRFWVALGSGEAANEHITGDGWPRKDVREQRLDECVSIIRRLLAGEEVSHDGLVTVDRARLWDLPQQQQPKLLAPVVSVESAARVASWADGLITVGQPVEQLRRVIDAYREAGGRGSLSLQLHLSWAATEEAAESIAHDQWRSNVFGAPVSWDTETTEAFDVMSENVSIAQVRESVQVSSDLGRHRAQLQELAELGFDDIYLHHVGQEQREFIETFGAEVLPQLATPTPTTASRA